MNTSSGSSSEDVASSIFVAEEKCSSIMTSTCPLESKERLWQVVENYDQSDSAIIQELEKESKLMHVSRKDAVDLNIQTNEVEIPFNQSMDEDILKKTNSGCIFCNQSRSGENAVKVMRVGSLLPSSFLTTFALLRYFGVPCSWFEKHPTSDEAVVDVCLQCHSVILEGDLAYQHILKVATKMQKLWPDIMNDQFSLNPLVILPSPKDLSSNVRNIEESDSPIDGTTDHEAFLDEELFNAESCKGDPVEEEVMVVQRKQKGKRKQCKKKGRKPKSKRCACGFCDLTFMDEERWECHIEAVHRIEGRWLQYNLQKVLKTSILEELQRNETNRSKPNFKCTACAATVDYDDFIRFADHLCNYHRFTVDKDYLNLMSTLSSIRGNESTNACRLGEVINQEKESLEAGGEVVTEGKGGKRTRSSTYIHKIFKNKRDFSSGIRKDQEKSGLYVIECEFCEQIVTDKVGYLLHISKCRHRPCSSSKAFDCNKCLYRSNAKLDLDHHKKCKHGHAKVKNDYELCDICGKLFKGRIIKDHIARMHSSTRNYACNFCDMKYFHHTTLRAHMNNTHADKLNIEWKCKQCDQTFKKYDQLSVHRLRVHSNKVHECMHCKKTYKRKSELTEHMKRKHLEKTKCVCNYCSKEFMDRSQWRKHVIKIHGVPRHEVWSKNYAPHKLENLRAKCQQPDVLQSTVIQVEERNADIEHFTPLGDSTSAGQQQPCVIVQEQKCQILEGVEDLSNIEIIW